MQHVHEKGLIHRDIKPSNLLVTSGKQGDAGIVKVLDLGLARLSGQRAQAASSQLTTMGSVMMGTPDYMAPEQAIDLRSADIRADVYSLGCTLFYLMTGQPPFPGASLAQKLMKHQQAPVPSVRQFRPEAPKALDSIIQKMLAKSPADRYQTPAEVVAALAPLASADRRTSVRRSLASTWSGKEVLQLPKGVAGPKNTRQALPLRRRRWPLFLGSAALLLAAGLTLLFAFSGGRAPQAGDPQRVSSNRPAAEDPSAPAPAQLEALTLLGDPRGRQWGNVTALAFSQDGKLVASAGQGPTIHIWDGATLAEVKTLPSQSRHVGAMAFSPDGRRLATACNGSNGQGCELKIWDVAGAKELKALPHPGATGSAVAFSSDGETVSLVNQRHVPPASQVIDFRAWQVATGHEKRPPIEAMESFAGRLSADGSSGLSLSLTGWKHWELGKGTSDLEGARGTNRGVPPHALTADGLTLFMANQRPAIVENVVTNEVQEVDLRPTEVNNRTQTHAFPEDHTIHLIIPGPQPHTVILWGRAPDGSKGGALRLWDFASGTPKRLALAPFQPWVSVLTISPDGKTLAVASNDGNLRLWDAGTLVERLPEGGHRGAVQLVAFADGDRSLISASAADATARAWDQAGGKERQRLALKASGSPNPFQGLNIASSADGAALAAWNQKAIRLLDPLGGKHHDVSLGADEVVQALAVSPDGRTMAGFVSNNLKFWNTANGSARSSLLPAAAPAGPMAFSVDGKLLAMANQRQENGRFLSGVRLVDVASGAERLGLPANLTNVQALTLSSDGRFLGVSAMRLEANRFTQEWKVWEVATSKERPLANALQGRVNLLFAPAAVPGSLEQQSVAGLGRGCRPDALPPASSRKAVRYTDGCLLARRPARGLCPQRRPGGPHRLCRRLSGPRVGPARPASQPGGFRRRPSDRRWQHERPDPSPPPIPALAAALLATQGKVTHCARPASGPRSPGSGAPAFPCRQRRSRGRAGSKTPCPCPVPKDSRCGTIHRRPSAPPEGRRPAPARGTARRTSRCAAA